jgi:hypothetical protein
MCAYNGYGSPFGCLMLLEKTRNFLYYCIHIYIYMCMYFLFVQCKVILGFLTMNKWFNLIELCFDVISLKFVVKLVINTVIKALVKKYFNWHRSTKRIFPVDREALCLNYSYSRAVGVGKRVFVELQFVCLIYCLLRNTEASVHSVLSEGRIYNLFSCQSLPPFTWQKNSQKRRVIPIQNGIIYNTKCTRNCDNYYNILIVL